MNIWLDKHSSRMRAILVCAMTTQWPIEKVLDRVDGRSPVWLDRPARGYVAAARQERERRLVRLTLLTLRTK